jgi:chromosome segregation ATPase
MIEATDNVVTEHLRAIRSKLDSLERKIDDLTLRVGAIERHVSGLRRDVSLVHEDIAIVHKRIDGVENHLARIDRRLELVDRRRAAGNLPDEIADTLGTTRNTVRAHLRSLFRKTRTNRQGALVAMLNRELAALSVLATEELDGRD